jgi:pyridoxamine 5'-phosphate oxidase family protein
MFTEKELAYIQSQRLARLATVSSDSQPDASPVGYRFDGQYFYISGRRNTATRKYKNVEAGNTQVALVIDDLESVDPWKPRGIRVFGTADIVEREGRHGPTMDLRITPTVSWSWRIEEGPAFQDGKFMTNRTEWEVKAQ